ncbi:hypothetical protein FZEAL_5837 [Fusarium zealandicum]|uniref:Uncharacterized protein n=1 Tax=Fusarium zealandicum TaxID=1053134 RepID=A0A8H4XK36_9HYPO|nr:hypothetical protein FZEAL_5837 [Fusarium zealandicum]
MAANTLFHAKFESAYHPDQVFPQPWVGDNPDIQKRRRYMKAFLEWMGPQEMHRYDELVREAEKAVALALKKAKWREVSSHYFAFVVDKVIWEGFFERRRPQSPPWPWSTVPDIKTEYGHTLSAGYDNLRRMPLSDLQPSKPVVPARPTIDIEKLDRGIVLPIERDCLQKVELKMNDLALQWQSAEGRGVFNAVKSAIAKLIHLNGTGYSELGLPATIGEPVPLCDNERHKLTDEVDRLANLNDILRSELKESVAKRNELSYGREESRIEIMELQERVSELKTRLKGRKSIGAHRVTGFGEGVSEVAPVESTFTLRSNLSAENRKRARPNTPLSTENNCDEVSALSAVFSTLAANSQRLHLAQDEPTSAASIAAALTSYLADGSRSGRLQKFLDEGPLETWVCIWTLFGGEFSEHEVGEPRVEGKYSYHLKVVVENEKRRLKFRQV